jgi:hypothetical protein
MSEPFDTWAREERAAHMQKAKLFAAWTAGWVLRKLATGACLALGGYAALRAVGVAI